MRDKRGDGGGIGSARNHLVELQMQVLYRRQRDIQHVHRVAQGQLPMWLRSIVSGIPAACKGTGTHVHLRLLARTGNSARVSDCMLKCMQQCGEVPCASSPLPMQCVWPSYGDEEVRWESAP